MFRIARSASPWTFPDWAKAGTDPSGFTTFGNRFDDPNGEYRVLYASSQILGCYIETLARFRPDLQLKDELAAIQGDDDFQQIGTVSAEWFQTRSLGKANVEGRFAEVYTAGWVGHLRSSLGMVCAGMGIAEFDLSVLMDAKNRVLTQRASDVVHDLGAYAGIYYPSRFGFDLENWAIFEYVSRIYPIDTRSVSPADPELLEALHILGLKLPEITEIKIGPEISDTPSSV